MNFARKWVFPPPTSPMNGAAIAPWLDNVATPYGPRNETIALMQKQGGNYEMLVLGLGG